MGKKYALDALQIQEILPHRYPFLLIDRVNELEVGVHGLAIKAVSLSDPCFQGHFPSQPIYPGVYILEGLAQIGALVTLGFEENTGKLGLFAGLDKVRFKDQVRPGDLLELEFVATRIRSTIGKGIGTARVDGKVVAEGEFFFMLSKPDKQEQE